MVLETKYVSLLLGTCQDAIMFLYRVLVTLKVRMPFIQGKFSSRSDRDEK